MQQVPGSRRPEILWAMTDCRPVLFNNVVRARLADHTVDGAIEAAIARGRSRHVNQAWWVGPSSTPEGLGTRLLAHGFTASGVLPGMAIELSAFPATPAPVSDLEVREVTDADSLELWSHVCGSALRSRLSHCALRATRGTR